MNVATAVVVALAATTAALGPALVAATHRPCDPYPIGRCGAYNREQVHFAYVVVDGRYVRATDAHVVAVGGPSLAAVDTEENARAYVRLGPVDAVLADPANAPAPDGAVWQESNGVPGLQPVAFKRGWFVWFEEVDPAMWFGPYSSVSRPPDGVVH